MALDFDPSGTSLDPEPSGTGLDPDPIGTGLDPEPSGWQPGSCGRNVQPEEKLEQNLVLCRNQGGGIYS